MKPTIKLIIIIYRCGGIEINIVSREALVYVDLGILSDKFVGSFWGFA